VTKWEEGEEGHCKDLYGYVQNASKMKVMKQGNVEDIEIQMHARKNY